jgi:hypothetical protein
MCRSRIEILPEGTTYYQNELRVMCESCFSTYEYDQYHIDMMMMRCHITPTMFKIPNKPVFFNHTPSDDQIMIRDSHDYMFQVWKDISFYDKRLFDGFDYDVFKRLTPLQQEYVDWDLGESVVEWNRKSDLRHYKSMQPTESLFVWDILELNCDDKMFWGGTTGILINRANNEQIAILSVLGKCKNSVTIMFNTFDEYQRARKCWEQREHIPNSDDNLAIREGKYNWSIDELRFLMSRANFATYCALLISELD